MLANVYKHLQMLASALEFESICELPTNTETLTSVRFVNVCGQLTNAHKHIQASHKLQSICKHCKHL